MTSVARALALAFVVIAALAAVGLASASSSYAQTAASPDRAALDVKIAKLTTALNAKTYEALVADIPPKLMAVMASKVGLPPDTFRKLIEAQMAKVMAEASIESFDVLPADIQTLANGARYALMPSRVRMNVQGKTAVSQGHVLAIVEDGQWYLVRVSERQWPVFRETYPEYADLQIPQEKLEFIP